MNTTFKRGDRVTVTNATSLYAGQVGTVIRPHNDEIEVSFVGEPGTGWLIADWCALVTQNTSQKVSPEDS